MIARIWRGVTATDRASGFARYMRRTGVPACLATRGNRGVVVLRRRLGKSGRVEFLFVSLWDSAAAIRRFAGPRPERPVYFAADRRYLTSLARTVRHFDVVVRREPARKRRSRTRRP